MLVQTVNSQTAVEVWIYRHSAGGSSTETRSIRTGIGSKGFSALPNPFKSSITLSLAGACGAAQVSVYDLNGRLMTGLTRGRNAADVQEFVWKPLGAPAGVYIVRAKAQGKTWSRNVFLEN